MTDTHSIVLYTMSHMFYLIHQLFCRIVKQGQNIYFSYLLIILKFKNVTRFCYVWTLWYSQCLQFWKVL